MLVKRIDGTVVNDEDGEIIDGLEEFTDPLDGCLAKALEAAEQAKRWDNRAKMFKSFALPLIQATGSDKYRSEAGLASVRATESVKRADILALRDRVEMTETEVLSILHDCMMTFNVKAFREACHRRQIPSEVIEETINTSVWLDVKPVLKYMEENND